MALRTQCCAEATTIPIHVVAEPLVGGGRQIEVPLLVVRRRWRRGCIFVALGCTRLAFRRAPEALDNRG
eukprot:334449-Lingulodinium_polyedra.AAC.1